MTGYVLRGLTGIVEWVLFYYFTFGLKRKKHFQVEMGIVASAFLIRTVVRTYFPAQDIGTSLAHNVSFYGLLYAAVYLLYDVQRIYAAFLAAVMLFSWGVWKNVVSPFTMSQMGLLTLAGLREEYIPIFCGFFEMVFMGVTTVLMKQRFVTVDSERTLTGREAFLSLFPAFVNYMTMVVLYYMVCFESSSISSRVAKAMVCLMVLHACSSLIILTATEQFFQNKKRDEELKQIENQMAFQYRNFEEQRQMDETMKMLYHDMNNHLNTIKHLSNEQAVSQYVGKLLQETRRAEDYLDTGNGFLNVLLEQKQTLCRNRGISLNVYVNFKDADFISPIDMNVLFANAIDNAVEAVGSLEDPARRQIEIRGGRMGNCLVVNFRNPYEKELKFRRGKLVTTKEDGAFHGIGLNSMRRVLEKYEGVMTIEAKDGWFGLKWMIPIVQLSAENVQL